MRRWIGPALLTSLLLLICYRSRYSLIVAVLLGFLLKRQLPKNVDVSPIKDWLKEWTEKRSIT